MRLALRVEYKSAETKPKHQIHSIHLRTVQKTGKNRTWQVYVTTVGIASLHLSMENVRIVIFINIGHSVIRPTDSEQIQPIQPRTCGSSQHDYEA